jgi:hypothetical protein
MQLQGNLMADLSIEAENPMLTVGDALTLGFATTFTLSWNDQKSGGRHSGAYFQPRVDTMEGYWPLGSLGIDNRGDYGYNPDGQQVVMVAKDVSKDKPALAAPVGYDYVWHDAGSGARLDGSMWRPQAPDGYVAVGLVCNSGYDAPSLDAVRCVRADLVVAATPGDLIWDDSRTGARKDFGSWQVVAPSAASGHVTLAPGTFCGAASHDKKAVFRETSTLYAFSLALPEQPPNQAIDYPQLDSIYSPGPTAPQSRIATTFLPWFAVNDPAYPPLQRMVKSPTYRLVRTDRYSLVHFFYNDMDSRDGTASVTYTEGVQGESATSFTSTTGIELGAEYGFSGALKGSIKLSQSFAHTSSSTSGWNRSETTTNSYQVAPQTAIAAYVIESTYDLYRHNGTQVNTGRSAAFNVPKTFYVTQFPRGRRVKRR